MSDVTGTWSPVREAGFPRLAAFADAAAFAVVAGAAAAIPLTFSISMQDVFALPKTLLTVVLAAMLAALLGVRGLATGARPHPGPLGIASLFLLAWQGLATAFAVDPGRALVGEPLQYQGLVATIAGVTFMAGARTSVHGDRRRRLLLIAIAAGLLPVAAYALAQRAGLDPIWRVLRLDRVFSTIGQANALAAYLVLAAAVAAGLAAARRAWGVAVAGLVGLTILALLFTMSRAGYLAAAVAAGTVLASAWAIRQPRTVAWRRVGLIGIAVGLALTSLLALPDVRGVAGKVATRALSAGDLADGSVRSHIDLWEVGVAISVDHPILGTGPDTYAEVFPEYRDTVLPADRASVMRRFRPESPHDVYIAMAAGAGLPALGAYLAIIALVGTGLVRVLRRRDLPIFQRWFAGAALAGISAHVVTDGFMTGEIAGTLVFWIVLGAGAALAKESRAVFGMAEQSGFDAVVRSAVARAPGQDRSMPQSR